MILSLFLAGCKDKEKRMGPGRMWSALECKYPNHLDLPSETEILQAITTLMVKQQQGKSIVLHMSRGIQYPYLDEVLRIYDNNPNITPAASWNLFVTKYPVYSAENYPDKSKVNSKISFFEKSLY